MKNQFHYFINHHITQVLSQTKLPLNEIIEELNQIKVYIDQIIDHLSNRLRT